MPILSSPYMPSYWLRHGHVQTLWPVLFRRAPPLQATRFRVDTEDGDFVDIDRVFAGNRQGRRVVLLSHGLEGNTQRKYMRGMTHCLLQHGWDVVGRNLRGCSGALPRTLGGYHMGATDDLHRVVQWCVEHDYASIVLAGFSMGGAQMFTYLGKDTQRVPAQVKAAVGISVPCDLVGASHQLSAWQCAIYMAYFMRTMHKKVRAQAQQHAAYPSIKALWRVRTFNEFDARFTAPLNGFTSAMDYWTRCSCNQYLPNITVPCFLLNAQDDPFMTPSCHPQAVARKSTLFTLELARYGGHVGFVTSASAYYSETRVATWLQHIFDK